MIVFFMLVSLLNCYYFYENRTVSDCAFYALSAFILLMYYNFFLFFKGQWRLRHFRGPFAMPLLGNCYQPGMRSLLRYLAVLRKQYGKIFTLQIFSKSYLVVLDPVIVRRVLSDNKVFVTDRDVSSAFGGMFGNRLLYSEVITARQRDVKNIVRRIFSPESVLRHLPVLNSLAAQAVDDLITHELQWMQNFAEDAFTVHVDQFFGSLTLRGFMNVALGADYRATPDKEQRACDSISQAGVAVQYLLCLTHLLPHWLLLPLYRVLRWRRSGVYRAVAGKIATHLAERGASAALGDDERDDFVTAILREELSVSEAAEHMVSLCGAGQDSSAYFASYACLLLARHPDVQTKLRASIVEQLSRGCDGGRRSEVTADDVAEMTYLHQVLQEVMRLYAIVPNALRTCTREVTVKDCSLSDHTFQSDSGGGHGASQPHARHGGAGSGGGGGNSVTIPAGTHLLIPLYLMNRDPTVWPDPAAFRPERFEPHPIGRSRAPHSPEDYSNARAGFYPFGYGNRPCVGAMMVQTEAAVMLCHLLLRVVLSPEPGFHCSINAATLLTPSRGVQVRMTVIRDETPMENLMR